MEHVLVVFLFISTFLMALISGFFYAYSCSVNIGLGRLKDAEYLRAMKSINRAVLNPNFFASFFGTLVTMPVTAWLYHVVTGGGWAYYTMLSATAIYIVGVFGVTAFRNVPLNKSLEEVDLENSFLEELKAKRLTYEAPWNRWHGIRTISSMVSLGLLLSVIVLR